MLSKFLIRLPLQILNFLKNPNFYVMMEETQKPTPKSVNFELINPEPSMKIEPPADQDLQKLIEPPADLDLPKWEEKTQEEDSSQQVGDSCKTHFYLPDLPNVPEEKTHGDAPPQGDGKNQDLKKVVDPDLPRVTEAKTHGVAPQEVCWSKMSHVELKNQLRFLQDEIFKSLNQNLLLKRRFLLAKSAIKRDMKGDLGCLEELVKKREEEGWCGSKEVVASFKKELDSLRARVRDKVRGKTPEKKREEGKMQGLLCMEREYMARNVRREEQKWAEDKDRLAKKLEFFEERNKELESEAASIRSEMHREPDSMEVVSVSKFLSLQRKMDHCLERKFRLNNSLLAAEASIAAHEAEIARLEAEVGRQEALLADSEATLEALAKGDGEDQDAMVEEMKVERDATSRTFREGLAEILDTHGALLRGHAECDVRRKCELTMAEDEDESPLVEEIRKRLEVDPKSTPKSVTSNYQGRKNRKSHNRSPDKPHRGKKVKFSGPDEVGAIDQPEASSSANKDPVSTGPPEPVPSSSRELQGELAPLDRPVEERKGVRKDSVKAILSNFGDFFDGNNELSTTQPPTHLVHCLERDLLQLSSSFAKKKEALRRRRWRLQSTFDRLKAEANHLLEARGKFAKTCAGVRVLAHKMKSVAKEADRVAKAASVEAFRFGEAAEAEDSRALLQAVRSENACLRRFVHSACDSIDEDVDKFLQLSAIKVFL